jgi:hypothetical protein
VQSALKAHGRAVGAIFSITNPRKPKVPQLDVAVPVKEDVPWFDVPVHHGTVLAAVALLHCQHDLSE